jgi:hypothetical protein
MFQEGAIHTQDSKELLVFFVTVATLCSMVISSATFYPIYHHASSPFTKFILFKLFCSWSGTILKLAVVLSLTCLELEDAGLVFTYSQRLVEGTFQMASLAGDVIMFVVYSYLVYSCTRHTKLDIKFITVPCALLFLVIIGVDVWAKLSPKQLLASRMDLNTRVRSPVLQFVHTVVHGSLVPLGVIFPVFMFVFFRKERASFKANSGYMTLMSCYLELYASSVVFQFPYSVTCIVNKVAPTEDSYAQIFRYAIAWRAMKGAVDSVLIYRLLVKKRGHFLTSKSTVSKTLTIGTQRTVIVRSNELQSTYKLNNFQND